MHRNIRTEAFPAEIRDVLVVQGELHTRLADPDFYKSAGGEVAAVNTRLAALEQELEGAFLRWDELESLKG